MFKENKKIKTNKNENIKTKQKNVGIPEIKNKPRTKVLKNRTIIYLKNIQQRNLKKKEKLQKKTNFKVKKTSKIKTKKKIMKRKKIDQR